MQDKHVFVEAMMAQMKEYHTSRSPYEEELKWRLYTLGGEKEEGRASKAANAGWTGPLTKEMDITMDMDDDMQ